VIETPFVGLVPYREEDADLFFGRDDEVRIVTGNLRSSRLTIVYGGSGVGKTSLLEAGAIHALHRQVLANAANGGRAPFAVCSFRAWRDEPLPALVETIRAAAAEAAGGAELTAWAPGEPLAETLRGWTEQVRTLLVVLDQFEDYFLYHPDEDGEGTFAGAFEGIVNEPNLRVNFVLSLREDAWAKLDRFEGRVPGLFANYVRIEHLDRDAAREAITGPVEEWNRRLPAGEAPYSVEPALVDAVVDAAAAGELTGADGAAGEAPRGDAIEAPFLQLVMERLWRATVAAGGRALTLARLEELGGAQRIVDNHLREALRALTRREQGVAADCFRYLVTRSKTKIAHPASDLAEWTRRREPEVTAVLDKLCRGESGRILRAVHPPSDTESTRYELFHDVLAEPILEWRRGYEQVRTIRRFSALGAGMLALLAVFAGLGVWALVQRNNARSATLAATSAALASDSNEQLGGHLERALLLGLAGYRAKQTVDARNALVSALEQARSLGLVALLHADSQVDAIAFAPDGRTLASGGANGTVRLWDVPGRRAEGSLAAPGSVTSVAFAPDRNAVAAGTSTGAVRVWNAATHRALGPTLHGAGSLDAVALGPGGKIAAAIGKGSTVWVWDVASGRQLARLRAPNGAPGANNDRTLALSADGRTLAAGDTSFDPDQRFAGGEVRIWDVASGKSLGTLPNEGAPVDELAFAPKGDTLLVSGYVDGGGYFQSHVQSQLWHARTLKPAGPALTTGSFVQRAAFGPGGSTLALARDNRVQLVSAKTWKPVGQPVDAGEAVAGLALSGDGHTVAVATAGDSTIRVFDLRRPPTFGRPVGPTSEVYDNVVFAPDGRSLAAGELYAVRVVDTATGKVTAVKKIGGTAVSIAYDGTRLAAAVDSGRVTIWNLRTGKHQGFRVGGETQLLALSPDGKTLAVATADDKLFLWSLPKHGLLGPVVKAAFPLALAFGAEGHTLVGAERDGSVRIWDVPNLGTSAEPLQRAVSGAVNAALAPDGRSVAFGTRNGVVVANLAGGAPAAVLQGGFSQDPGAVLAFSPDGLTLASVGDKQVRLWDVEAHRPLGPPLRTSGYVTAVAFSPDGRGIAAAGESLWLWPGMLWQNAADLRRSLCALVVGNLTTQEWSSLAPGVGYRRTCPG
jgi:WD40 repeat protein